MNRIVDFHQVSIPDRVLGFFRPGGCKEVLQSIAPYVSIPDRVLGFFRHNLLYVALTRGKKFQSLIGF